MADSEEPKEATITTLRDMMEQIEEEIPRAVIVIAFPLPKGKNSLMEFQEKLNKVKPIFEGEEDVKVYGAVDQVAENVLYLLGRGT